MQDCLSTIPNHNFIICLSRNCVWPSREAADQQPAGLLSEAGAACGQRVRCNPAEVWAYSAADYERGEFSETRI